MDTLILIGLIAAVLIATAGSLYARPQLPPQVILVPSVTVDRQGSGCLPLIVLIAVVLLAINLM